jgi:NAD(P)-dependent dehydrogenase (short-subunit alcohol dehydrogenase family)
MPTVLITGGHGGLGFVAAKQLASDSKLNLVLAGRSMDAVRRAAEEIRSASGVKVTALSLDLSSLASVRQAAKETRAMLNSGEIDSLQAILCNAGGRKEDISYSIDGYEETFATNQLGHFLLVNLLIDCLAENGRVIFTASGTHDPERVDGRMVGAAEEPDAQALAFCGTKEFPPISAGKRYSASKLCNVLTAYELDRRLRKSSSSLAAIAFDPGQVSGTGFLRTMPKPVQWLSKTAFFHFVSKRMGVTMGSLPFSGACLAKIAADPGFATKSGKYFESNDGSLIEARSSKVSYDSNRAAKLWL